MRLKLTLACACACALIFALSALADAPVPEPDAQTTDQPSSQDLQAAIDRYRRITWHWQRVMSTPLTLTLSNPPAALADRIPVWKAIAVRTRELALHPPHQHAWACIHRYEGSWTDPGAPYYGGLQMDLGFQRTYGRALLTLKGTADHWTPLEQMWVAEKALRAGRGFWPWPNTARYCGLL